MIEALCAEQNMLQFSEFNYKNGSALKTLVEKHDVKLRKLPDDVLIALGNAAGEVLQELMDSSDPLTAKIGSALIRI